MSRFDGFRVYNGCPDSMLQEKLDAHKSVMKRALKICPTLFCTYFPVEEYYSICSNEKFGKWLAYEYIVRGCDNKLEAWSMVLKILEGMDNGKI